MGRKEHFWRQKPILLYTWWGQHGLPRQTSLKAQADVKDLSAQIHPSDGGSQLALLLVYLHPVAPWHECIKDFGASV